MKKVFILFFLTFLISFTATAQKGFDYKAHRAKGAKASLHANKGNKGKSLTSRSCSYGKAQKAAMNKAAKRRRK